MKILVTEKYTRYYATAGKQRLGRGVLYELRAILYTVRAEAR
jgi:hypothetical protein